MNVVDASIGTIVTQVVQQVSDIVQQRGNNFGAWPILLLGQLGGLECVLELSHLFTAVEFATLCVEEFLELVDEQLESIGRVVFGVHRVGSGGLLGAVVAARLSCRSLSRQ